MFSGWSIEKKPDIFSSMIGREYGHDPTAAGPPFYGICYMPAYVWKDNMNASLDSPIQNPSTLFNDYFNIYPEQLSCDRIGWTKPPKEFTETPVTEKPSENIYFYSSFKDCIDKKNALFGSQEWWDCWNLFFDYLPNDKPYVTGIDVSPIDAKNNKYANFNMTKNKDGINYHMRNEQVSNGLYHVAYIFNNGEIISTIDELIFADKLTPFKDLVTVNVYPNKIENNLLNFDLKAFGAVSFNLIVQDLNGNTLYSENLILAKDELLNKKITIPCTTTDYNQLRLNLQFIDGSIIQKTILK